MSRKLLRISSVLLLTLLGADRVFAAGCAPAGSSENRESQNLVRQVSALRGLMNKYDCGAGQGKSSLACSDLSRRLAGAEQSVAAKGGGRCSAKAPEQTRRKIARSGDDGPMRPSSSKKLATMCVRLSDGYYFPSPNSGYGSAKDEPVIAAQCRFICDTADMEVFHIGSGTGSTDEMISLKTGVRYSDMPNAGAYKNAASAMRCDMARYHKRAGDLIRIASLRAGDVETASLAGAEREPVAVAMARPVAFVDDRIEVTPPRREISVQPRKVRVVLAGFLPGEDTSMALNTVP